MSTYEKELNEIQEAWKQEEEKYDAAINERIRQGRFSRDSEASHYIEKVRLKYLEKIRQLKKKYNR